MKVIFLFLSFIYSLFGTVDANGWASVERPKKTPFQESLEVEDLSVWVVFSKDLGSEKIFIQFPEDPTYTYLTPDEMEVRSEKGGRGYLLRVLSSSGAEEFLEARAKEVALHPDTLMIEEKRPSANTLDLLYERGGKWFWERVYFTEKHLYFLQTVSDDLLASGHEKFVQSFEVNN